uniref:COMM domain-containing protein 5 n=1 Tax=Angiostrongylus cantonensis TaxID=6313 RepID=A0A0K0DQ58_ANGCA
MGNCGSICPGIQVLRISQHHFDAFIESLENSFISSTSTPNYSLLSKRLNIEEHVITKVIHDIIKLAANIAELDAKDEKILDAICCPFNGKVKQFIHQFAQAMRLQPHQMTSFISRQCHPTSILTYSDSSLRLDVDIAKRSLMEIGQTPDIVFIWRLRLLNSDDVVLRISPEMMLRLAQHLDKLSLKMQSFRRGRLQYLNHCIVASAYCIELVAIPTYLALFLR